MANRPGCRHDRPQNHGQNANRRPSIRKDFRQAVLLPRLHCAKTNAMRQSIGPIGGYVTPLIVDRLGADPKPSTLSPAAAGAHRLRLSGSKEHERLRLVGSRTFATTGPLTHMTTSGPPDAGSGAIAPTRKAQRGHNRPLEFPRPGRALHTSMRAPRKVFRLPPVGGPNPQQERLKCRTSVPPIPLIIMSAPG